MAAKLLLVLPLLALVLLTGCHEPGHRAPPPSECGGFFQPPCGGSGQAAKPVKCAPTVHWVRPAKGTVVDTKQCSGFLGITTTYAKIDVYKSKAVVWAVDSVGRCRVGDSWDTGLPSGCPL